MPFVGQAIPVLLGQARRVSSGVDGIIGVADGHRQWMCALYRLPALARACSRLPIGGSGESLRHLVGDLVLVDVALPPGSSTDIDTVQDLAALGFRVHEG
ncbi:MAG: hypothetical protein FWD75_05700 [Propionibacteriaceae bacterium]|nr:hypothetical protein [Propionibacteriaceae bacterium]